MLNRKKVAALLISYADYKWLAWEDDTDLSNFAQNRDDLREEIQSWGRDIGLSEEEMAIVMAECFGEGVN